jgi:hypothetical protein
VQLDRHSFDVFQLIRSSQRLIPPQQHIASDCGDQFYNLHPSEWAFMRVWPPTRL